jgi:prepilin-type N-terminal cleavage/methylation domain-containing protein
MNKLIEKAFTLIELLVVIAIIGILSGLIVVSMRGMTTKAPIAKAQVFSNSLRNSLMLNLISEWKLDPVGTALTDGLSATTIYTQDSWGGGNNGTIAGTTAPTVQSGSKCVYGSCLYFGGAGYISIPSASNLNFGSGSFTLSGWMKTTNSVLSGAPIIGKGSIATNSPKYGVRFTAVDTICVDLADGTNGGQCTLSSSGSFNVSDNSWHFAVATIDRNFQKIYGYVDGKLVNSISISTIGSVDSSYFLGIGNTQGAGVFVGSIDEVRVFNAALSTSQIKEQYYVGLNNLLSNGSIAAVEYAERMGEIAKQ